MVNQLYVIFFLSLLLVITTSLAIYGYNKKNEPEPCDCEDVVNEALLEADKRAKTLYRYSRELLKTHTLKTNQLTNNHPDEFVGRAFNSLTDSQLLDPYYNNEKAKYTTDIIDVVYYLGTNFQYSDTTANDAKAWVQKQLGPSVTCVEVIDFTVSNLDFVKWFNSFGAIILKQTLTDGGEYYFIVFRGTVYLSEYLEDAKIALTSVPYLPSNSKIFVGFNNIYNNYLNPGVTISVRNQIRNAMIKYNIKNSKGLTICGHSLGAALAMLTAIDLSNSNSVDLNKMDLYTCASPAITNTYASTILKSNRLFIVQNTKDLVALTSATNSWLTKLLGLKVTPHTSCCFTGNNTDTSHSLYTYADAITQYGNSWVAKSRSGNIRELGEVCSL